MESRGYRTIEDRLEQIEGDLVQVKLMLSDFLSKKPVQSVQTDEPFMNVKEVAQFLKVDVAVIYSACAKGEIKFLKIGKLYKFKKECVLEWLEKVKNNRVDIDDYVEKYLKKNILKG